MSDNQDENNLNSTEMPEAISESSHPETVRRRRCDSGPAQETIEQNPPPQSAITEEAIRGIVGGELISLKQQIGRLEETVTKLSSVCKESIDYGQRYQKNTVTVLQSELKEKDRYINGLLLVDLLKPIAVVAAKIEKRISKATMPADRKFLQDLLDEITETVEDEYEVQIVRTSTGQPRPENISQVAEVVLTGNEKLKNLVAESINSCWMINGKVIQKERVKMYKFDPALAPTEPETNPGEEVPQDEPGQITAEHGSSTEETVSLEGNPTVPSAVEEKILPVISEAVHYEQTVSEGEPVLDEGNVTPIPVDEEASEQIVAGNADLHEETLSSIETTETFFKVNHEIPLPIDNDASLEHLQPAIVEIPAENEPTEAPKG